MIFLGLGVEVRDDRATLAGLTSPPCLVLSATEIPCPGCGLTRGTACVVQGRWGDAAHYHLGSFAVVGALVAESVAQQVRKAISKNTLKNNSQHEEYGKITISLGVGEFQEGETPDHLLDRADKALYQAKESGRNRVEKAI